MKSEPLKTSKGSYLTTMEGLVSSSKLWKIAQTGSPKGNRLNLGRSDMAFFSDESGKKKRRKPFNWNPPKKCSLILKE